MDLFDKKWFLNIKSVDNARATVLCFPCGGGSASSFWPWQSIPFDANVWGLKLPGRDSRIAETSITSPAELVNHIITAFPDTFRTPLVFYGHSMGAGIAFEIIHELQKQQRALPELFIASGREPPHVDYRFSVNHLNDDELLDYVKKLGGVSGDLPTSRDFLNHYLPKIRADYQLNGNIPKRAAVKLPLPIAIVNGDEDPLLRTAILPQWEQHTAHPLTSGFLPGDHFFMERNFPVFLEKIAEYLTLINRD